MSVRFTACCSPISVSRSITSWKLMSRSRPNWGRCACLRQTCRSGQRTGGSLRGGRCMRLLAVFVRSGGSAWAPSALMRIARGGQSLRLTWLLSTSQASPARRVRVVEIGVLDGSSVVLFDGTAAEARAEFLAHGRSRAAAAADNDHVVPCRSCGDCKAAGVCRALVPVDEMLGQRQRGLSSRSVSASELEQYVRCPGQWLLDSGAHLPREEADGDGAFRGRAVHRWLQAAHARQLPCTSADMPVPGSGLGLADGVLTETEYEIAYPFLMQHAGLCPLAAEMSSPVLADENIYGYDHDAEVVPVIRPDLLYRAGRLPRDPGVQDCRAAVRVRKRRSIRQAPANRIRYRHAQLRFARPLRCEHRNGWNWNFS